MRERADGPKTVSKKLLIRAGDTVAVIDPPSGYEGLLDPLPEGVRRGSQMGTDSDVILIFARTGAAAQDAGAALGDVKAEARVWIAYPKGGEKAGTDLNRDILWQLMGEVGLTGVTLVSLDDTWSAMRFRSDHRRP